jgi:DNA-binding SARP family transcriptional activator
VAAVGAAFLGGWTFGNSTLPARAAALLREIFSDAKTTAAVASAAFALLSLGVQLWVGGRQADIGRRQAEASRISADAAMLTAMNAGNRAVASMRLQWVEKMREILSEYHSTLVSVEDPIPETDLRRLSNLGTQLDLMMNLNEPIQKALWDLAEKTYRTEGLQERKDLDPALMEAGRVVLKAEWEKIKREQRGEE